MTATEFVLRYLLGVALGLTSLAIAKVAARMVINRDKKRRLLSYGSATVRHDNQKG